MWADERLSAVQRHSSAEVILREMRSRRNSHSQHKSESLDCRNLFISTLNKYSVISSYKCTVCVACCVFLLRLKHCYNCICYIEFKKNSSRPTVYLTVLILCTLNVCTVTQHNYLSCLHFSFIELHSPV